MPSRPQTLDELIGQATVKQKAQIAVGAALKRGEPLPHCLLTSAGGGLGKTTFAAILANEMFAPLVSTTGQCLMDAADLRSVLIRLKANSLLLVDEFHCLGRLAGEELLLVLEEGVLNINVGGDAAPLRLPVPPFTLVAATTQPAAISAPLDQRFGLTFHFDFYPVADLRRIVMGYSDQMGIMFEPAVLDGIARRSLGVPRVALRLAERVRDVVQARGLSAASTAELELAMGLDGIDHLGLRPEHRHILQTLADARPRPVSARSLALAIGAEAATITGVLEPTLIRLGLMLVGAGGRRITERGLIHLDQVAQTG